MPARPITKPAELISIEIELKRMLRITAFTLAYECSGSVATHSPAGGRFASCLA
jgi:hypothetical protein